MNEEHYEVLTEELIRTIGKMRKELLWTRVFCSILTVVMVGVLVMGGVCMYKAQQYGTQLVEYMEQIEEYMVEVEPVLNQLAQVDVEAINGAIASLDVEAVNDAMEDIDFENLGETITRLDEIMDNLDEASEKLQSVTDGIGDFFGWSE